MLLRTSPISREMLLINLTKSFQPDHKELVFCFVLFGVVVVDGKLFLLP